MTRRRIAAAAVTVTAVAFLATGLWGAFSYAHDYYLYRGFGPPREAAGVAHGRLVHVRFYSRALGARNDYDVYLPAGYAAAARHGRRFSVMYLLHGSPGSPKSFTGIGDLGVADDRLVARHVIPPFLIVMPDGGHGTFANDTEWANTRDGRYADFVLDVVHEVDRRWPTRAERRFRAIAGLSMGAYGAINIALRHLDVFATAQSWSGYFTQTATGPFHGADRAQLRAASPAAFAGSLRAQLRRFPLHVLLYGGRSDPDTRQIPGFAAELRAAGADVETRLYAGGHDWALWRREMPMALRNVAAHLGRP